MLEHAYVEVASIAAICSLVRMAVLKSPPLTAWATEICGLAGGLLGMAAVFVMPAFYGTDMISAIAIGITAGLSTAGASRVIQHMQHKGAA